MQVKKIGASEGHSKHTAGKRTPAGEREWYFNNLMGQGFRSEAEKYDVEIVLVSDPTGERDVPLQERTDIANEEECDLYISFHHNAYKGVWGTHTGTDTFVYHDKPQADLQLAETAQNAILSVYQLRDRGIKSANFHEVREPNMPACLTEGGFMDSSIDIKVMRDSAKVREAGREVFRRLAEVYGIKKNPVVTPSTSATVYYRVQVGAFKQIAGAARLSHEIEEKLNVKTIIVEADGFLKVQAGAFKHKDNADARLKAFKDAGYTDAFITIKGGDAVSIAEPPNEPEPEYDRLTVDGSWGDNTTRRLQEVLGTPETGKIGGQSRHAVTENIHSVEFGSGGSAVVRAMQKELGVRADGSFGPATLRALQHHLGTPMTGLISKSNSMVVKALQRRLNQNKF